MRSMGLLLRWKFPLFLWVILSVLYLHYFENRAYVELDASVTQRSWFTFYWAGEGEHYSKWRAVRIRLNPKQKQYRFRSVDLRSVERLRVDTHDYKGDFVLRGMVIKQNGFLPLRFQNKDDFSLLTPLNDIKSTHVDTSQLKIQSTGSDPQLELKINLQESESRVGIISFHLVTLFFVIVLFFYCTEKYRDEKKYIPLFLTAAFVLVVVMAFISKENVHPDEYVHLDSGEYYIDHWLPPVVGDVDIQHTYSVYGVSRLNSREIAYIFIGKTASVLSNFKLTRAASLRMFNVLLFGVLLLFILRNPRARLMAIPLIISPQLWYVFSYCNSDAFALAVSFIVSCQVVLPDSLFNNYVMDPKGKRSVYTVLLLGFSCGLLFLLKKNYIFFLAFLVGYIFWRMFYLVELEIRRQYLRRIFVIVFLGMSVAGIRVGLDYVVNGWDRDAKVEQMQEERATTLYKPSTPLQKKHTFLYRKARGDSIQKLIVVDRWFEKIYRSAFGMYGYFTAVATDAYYDTVRPVAVLLLLFLCVFVFFRGGLSGNLLLFLFLGGSVALIGASFYHSWTVDFQSQGRYLFPIVPMSCVVVFHFRKLMQNAVYKSLVTAMFFLSVYSFVFVGLLKIAKIS